MPPVERLNFLDLPAEIIDHIFRYLTPYELIDLQATCRSLKAHALNDRLWHDFVQENLHTRLDDPHPSNSWRELFVRHHPRWFLVKHKLWFSDLSHHGRLILARYDPRRGCIEAHRIVSERRPCQHGLMEWDKSLVVYHTFNPKVQLDLNKPVVQLNLGDSGSQKRATDDICMEIYSGTADRTRNKFLYTRSLPSHLKTPQTQLWPPMTLPAQGDQRTRCASNSMFRSAGHNPERLSQVSDNTFRIRQWLEFSYFDPGILERMTRGGIVGEQVMTYATLPAECYTPTPEKPWQGIWVGDYSTHGCEFLVIIQPDEDDLSLPQMPRKAKKAFLTWPETSVDLLADGGHVGNANTDGGINDEASDDDEPPVLPTNITRLNEYLQRRRTSAGHVWPADTVKTFESSDTAPYKGSLFAIKLTGDPNIPRGEFTFIAEDLGAKGFLRHTTEPLFTRANDGNGEDEAFSVKSKLPGLGNGARVVRSVGHIANAAFRDDAYIPSQLILMSENKLAQYWKPFNQISFYERIDLDSLL